jgi:hypothetical protein
MSRYEARLRQLEVVLEHTTSHADRSRLMGELQSLREAIHRQHSPERVDTTAS